MDLKAQYEQETGEDTVRYFGQLAYYYNPEYVQWLETKALPKTNLTQLKADVDALIEAAKAEKDKFKPSAINWARLRCTGVYERRSETGDVDLMVEIMGDLPGSPIESYAWPMLRGKYGPVDIRMEL